MMAQIEINDKKATLRCTKLEMMNKEHDNRLKLIAQTFADEKKLSASREYKKDLQVEGCNAHIDDVCRRITKMVG